MKAVAPVLVKPQWAFESVWLKRLLKKRDGMSGYEIMAAPVITFIDKLVIYFLLWIDVMAVFWS